MTISAAIRGTLTRTAGVIALTLALISPAGITGGLMGQQNSQPGQQQNCPAQGTQNNGQQGQQSQEGQQNGANNGQNNNCNQPAPLFGGALSIKKSNQTTDSAALGFNGVDPNGQVQQAFLNSAPSADSEKKAEAMAAYRPTPAALVTFEKDGGLPQSATPAAAGAAAPNGH